MRFDSQKDSRQDRRHELKGELQSIRSTTPSAMLWELTNGTVRSRDRVYLMCVINDSPKHTNTHLETTHTRPLATACTIMLYYLKDNSGIFFDQKIKLNIYILSFIIIIFNAKHYITSCNI